MSRRPARWALAAAVLAVAACGRTSDGTLDEIKLKPVRTTAASPRTVVLPSPFPTLTHGSAKPGTPTPGPAPTEVLPSAMGPTGRSLIVSGNVYDAAGAPVDAAVVLVASLDQRVPYYAVVPTVAGAFVLTGVPEGVNIRVTASKPGWTSRRRIASFDGNDSERHLVTFGSASGAADTADTPYFLSPWPEVERTEPNADATGVDPRGGAYRLAFSEPLSEEGRRRFEAAFRLLPANDAANGGVVGKTTDLTTRDDAAMPLHQTVDGDPVVAPYALGKGSVYRNDPATRASFTWEFDNREVVFRFGGPLLASATDACAYQIALVSGGPDQRILDGDGHQLGMGADGSQTSYPPRGELLPAVFADRMLTLRTIAGLAEPARARWAGTHRHSVPFQLALDETAPALVDVAVVPQNGDLRFELTFDEPMAAFDGSAGGFVHPSLGDDADDLTRYSFALGKRAADVAEVTLDGSVEATDEFDPRLSPTLPADWVGRELRFTPAAWVANATGALPGSIVVEVDPFDPRRVDLVVLGRADMFDPSLGAIKVRARLGDPAGNMIQTGNADRQARSAAL